MASFKLGAYIHSVYLHVQWNVEALEMEVILALHELPVSSEHPMEFEHNPLNLKLDNLYINMGDIALNLGKHGRSVYPSHQMPASIDPTHGNHNDGFWSFQAEMVQCCMSDHL